MIIKISFRKLALISLLSALSSTHCAYALSTCDAGVDCDVSINGNTFLNQESNQSVLTELQTKYGFGTSTFLAGTDLNDINATINTASYMASRFLITNLTLPVFNISTISSAHFDIAVNDGSTFSTNLNIIHDLYKSSLLTNFFVSESNNGYNPITDLDIESYAFPRASQISKNNIAGVTPILFLNYLNATSATADTIASKFETYCPARSSTYSRDSDTATCIQPFDQLNTASGSGFDSSEGATDDVGTRFSTTLPSYWDFLQQTVSNDVLPSLTASTLINPLTYEDDTSSGEYSLPLDTTLGLYGRTELAAADNFIRYLSGDLLPSGLSTSDEYQLYYNIATGSACYQYRLDAAMKIKAYRIMLRNYAAQTSVGTGNLYYLMQKRRLIAESGNTTVKTSQMEQEYKMATYRLFNPDSATTQKTTEWQDRLATASSSAIQRQMAVLLAEINYQLFLNRKEQERILLTLSAMHLSNTAQLKKSLNINEAASYISPIQTPMKTVDSQCTGETLSNSDG